MPGRGPVHSAVRRPATEAPGDAATPATPVPAGNAAISRAPSLMDKPAEPAKITLNGGLLTIKADNSSLSDILHRLASSGGISVDGYQKDQRVFGTYGPGNPRDVLSGMLQDAGYNFLMVGVTEQGTPKQIVLTARHGGGAVAGGGPAQTETDDQPDESDDNSDNNNAPPEIEAPEQPAPPAAPGAEAPNSNGRVKTPAEIIQELQRMRQQQQNPQ